MSRNAQAACIAEANQRDEQRATERMEMAMVASTPQAGAIPNLTAAQWESMYAVQCECTDEWVEKYRALRADLITLALRLHFEDDDMHAPETREVLARWRPVVNAEIARRTA